jgi:hypothetical protein
MADLWRASYLLTFGLQGGCLLDGMLCVSFAERMSFHSEQEVQGELFPRCKDIMIYRATFAYTALAFPFHSSLSSVQHTNYLKWVSAQRRSESPESTVPDTVVPSESSVARSRFLRTAPTVASFAERTRSSELVLESGNADRAVRWSLVVHTHSPRHLLWLCARQSDVCVKCNRTTPKLFIPIVEQTIHEEKVFL